MNCIYVSDIPSTHNQRENLYNILNDCEHETKFHDVVFSTCGIIVSAEKILGVRLFWISDFWVRDD
jgi:hypothetical protein